MKKSVSFTKIILGILFAVALFFTVHSSFLSSQNCCAENVAQSPKRKIAQKQVYAI